MKLILIISLFICIFLVIAGCLHGNSEQLTLQPATNEPTVQSMKNPNLTQDEAKIMILSQFGSNKTSLIYNRTLTDTNSATLYEFISDSGIFQVNSVTHEIQNIHFADPASPSMVNIDLEKAYAIANSYAREKNPGFWVITDQRGVLNTYKDLNPTYGYDFVWREALYYPNNTIPGYYQITGLNSTNVCITGSGSLSLYRERLIPLNMSLNLQPDLTEDHAWDLAQGIYVMRGVSDMRPVTKRGLWITIPKDNEQHLVWYFEAYGKANRGGIAWVDAHDGQIFEWVG